MTFQPCDSNSVMNVLSTPVSLYSTRRKVYALPVDPLTVEFVPDVGINVTQGMADESCIVINCLDHAHLRCGRGNPATN
jgi:hypothetical protein